MRFRLKEHKYIHAGTNRVIRKFLWWPRRVKDAVVWLEYARIRQMTEYDIIGRRGKWIEMEVLHNSDTIDYKELLYNGR